MIIAFISMKVKLKFDTNWKQNMLLIQVKITYREMDFFNHISSLGYEEIYGGLYGYWEKEG